MTSSFRSAPALALALLAPLLGCATGATHPTPLTCAEPCGEVRSVSYPDTVEVEVLVPAGTRLENASLASAGSVACQSGVPVSAVTLDGRRIDEGPAPLAPVAQLSLRFPFVADDDRPSAGLVPPVSLDLDVSGPNHRHCLRLPLPVPTGFLAIVQQLSFRLEARP